MTEAQFIKAVALAISKAESADHAAIAIHGICLKACEDEGQKPDIEVMLAAPGAPRFNGMDDGWTVAWEAGPHDWAVQATLMASNKAFSAEPYYGFDINLSARGAQ